MSASSIMEWLTPASGVGIVAAMALLCGGYCYDPSNKVEVEK